jgi:hypothetical protein
MEVLSAPEVAEAEPRFPRNRHDAPAGVSRGDARQLGDRRRHLREVLQHLDAQHEIGSIVA